jgi:hypothetical protein
VIGTLNNLIYSSKLLSDTGTTMSSIPKPLANNLWIR